MCTRADYTVIKWIVIDREDKQFGLTYLESFDEGDEDFHDVHEFSVIDPADEPHGTTHLFGSVEAAVASVIRNYGASANKFVAFAIIEKEYQKYLLKETSILMRREDLPERWKLKLQECLTTKGSTKTEKLSTSEFPSDTTVSIQFEDDSHVEFRYAFVIEAPEFREVAVFTEHCGYHLFPLYDGLELTIN